MMVLAATNPPLYLRVKNWGEFQHYRDRNPPWIKIHNALLRDDDFLALAELPQWQLVRIWLIASRGERFTRDENSRLVPAISADENWIRRAIGSLKKVPVDAFIKDGWLIVLEETDLHNPDLDASAGASTSASTDASIGSSCCRYQSGPEITEVSEVKKDLSSNPVAFTSFDGGKGNDLSIRREIAKALRPVDPEAA